MAGTVKRLAGPAYIANAAANIYVPSSALIYGNIKHMHIANVTGGAVTFTLYIGATGGSAGGTELEKAYSIAANSDWDRYFANLKLVSTDFLTGLASAATSLVITVMGEEVVV
jgi:hypothetical protein